VSRASPVPSELMTYEEDADLARRTAGVERELRLAALHAERDNVFRMMHAREIGSATGMKLVRELDIIDASFRE
jgi:hypothetical protein